LDNRGSVSAIDGGSGTPLRVSGTYSQSSEATLLLRDEAGSFTQLKAHVASLSGAVDLFILDALKPGTAYPILLAPSIEGRFGQIAGYRLTYSPGRVAAIVTPQIQLSKSEVAPGRALGVGGASFGYLGTVELHLDTANGPVIGSGNVTSVGFFQASARIPHNTAAGDHLIVAINTAYGFRAQRRLTVT
jgi:hypothetical protein